MDLVGFAQDAFDAVAGEMRAFLAHVKIHPLAFIPVSGRGGDNIGLRSTAMAWYSGPTVLEALDSFSTQPPLARKPFRMPVQDVYKFTRFGDERRIVAGSITSGALRPGDEVVFYPSGKRSRVRSLEAFNAPPPSAIEAGQAAGFTLDEQIYVTRGEVAVRSDEPKPLVSRRLRVSLFWLGREPLSEGREYVFKLGAARVPMHVERVEQVLDASNLQSQGTRTRVERHEVAECTLELQRAAAFDLASELPPTGRFVVVSDYEISGGGVIREALPDKEEWIRDKVQLRNAAWESSLITGERRAEKYNQRATLVLVTGERWTDRKKLAKALEARLFEDGKIVYFLGMGNVLHGVDADVEARPENQLEHFRRLGEVAHILLDAGVILIVSAAEVAEAELQVLRTTLRPERIVTAWLGQPPAGQTWDLVLTDGDRDGRGCEALKLLLQEQGIIFRP
jgi:bifunctional enzyme CysN/CysC